jgi:drug/metabolite transporter (DMT)-like permease
MSSERDDGRWVAAVLFTAFNLCLAVLLWLVGGLCLGLLRRYRRHGHRLGLWLAAAGFVLALVCAAMVTVVAGGMVGVVMAIAALGGWVVIVTLLAVVYDVQDRQTDGALERETLVDVLTGTRRHTK